MKIMNNVFLNKLVMYSNLVSESGEVSIRDQTFIENYIENFKLPKEFKILTDNDTHNLGLFETLEEFLKTSEDLKHSSDAVIKSLVCILLYLQTQDK